MKAIYLLIVGIVIMFSVPARSDPLILDSFSQGGLNLSDSGAARDIDFIAPSLVNIRDVKGLGGAFWTAILDPNVSILRYNVEAPGPPDGSNSLVLTYFNNGNAFSITNYTAFYLAIPEVIGTGELYVLAGGGILSSIPHPISQPGEIFYNFSLMTGGEWMSPVTNISFIIKPTSQNFSVGVDHIALIPAVPEPCSALLLLTATGLLAMRRRRGH